MAEGNGRSWSNEIMELGDKIANLKVSQAVELGDYLEEKYWEVQDSIQRGMNALARKRALPLFG